MLESRTVAVLGVGKIGEILIRGLLRSGKVTADRIAGSLGHEESVARVRKRIEEPVDLSADSARAAAGRDLILLAVKPQMMTRLLDQVAPVIEPEQLVVTVAASVTTDFIERRLKAGVAVVRAMPNTPCLLGSGMTAIAPGSHARESDLALAREVFDSVGRTTILEERLMDGVTGLSGSGPAYIYLIIEALSEAGVKLGIPRDKATLLSAQTVYGAARMVLELGEHPALLKDVVTTPAGCTIDGLLELEEGKLRVTLVKAVVKAAERARALILEG